MMAEESAVSNDGNTLENMCPNMDVSEKSNGSELLHIISSNSLKTSELMSSVSFTRHEMDTQTGESGDSNLLDLYGKFESKQKQLNTLKKELSAVIHELSEIESQLDDNEASKNLGFSEELSITKEEAFLHQEIIQIQALIAENGLLRAKLGLSEKSRSDFRKKVESTLEEELKRKLELEIEIRSVKKKLEETLALNEDLTRKVDVYRNKSREARSSLSDTITRMKSTILGPTDIETRRNSNFSLNESLLAYWELI